MVSNILLDPLLPWPLLAGVTVGLCLLLALALWRGLSGWALRGLGALVILSGLLNPSLQQEERDPLNDIVLMVIDRTASQEIGGREAQAEAAAERMRAAIEERPDTELREVTLGDSGDNQGTLLLSRVRQALADIPSDRLAGIILVTDGQVHDAGLVPGAGAPMHALLTGRSEDWDRRLAVTQAPPFAILGEPVSLTVRVDDLGAAPAAAGGMAEVAISIDGGQAQRFSLPVGEPADLPLTLPHGGMNTLQFTTPLQDGELTDRNNAAMIRINGVRDRLRVLLVSGEPHPGERTWRNLLKSDSSVDLVHFTILRPPEKQDGVPVNELSLIAFPTRELFLEKIDEFDLIVFDRYKRRGILPSVYLENVASYVERGGAVLFAAGPDFASADSLFHTALSEVIPAKPTARVIERGFTPTISATGRRHPVTSGLEDYAPAFAADAAEAAEEGGPAWGRWLRQVDLRVDAGGQTVMTGAEERPLLVLDRIGEGRVALLGSDHSWLWSRGFEGGGPQLELLRRLAHWMMKEPELEEESLRAEAQGQAMTVIRRTLSDEASDVEITTPSGEVAGVELSETAPGRFEARYDGPEPGLYRLTDGELEAVIALGPSSPREFEETIATGAVLEPAISATGGGSPRLEDGLPRLRDVRPGRPAAGRGWIGLTPRGAYVTTAVTVRPFLPPWAFLLLATGFLLLGWLREGRH